MRKPRKSPDEKPKKRLDKKQLLMLPAAASVGLVVIFIMNQFTPKILEECLTSDVQPFSIMIDLEILLDGQPMNIPPNLGYDENCIKPIHLHGINKVHVIYHKELRVTLFELIKLLNLDIDKYNHQIFVKLPENNEFLPFRGGQKALPLEDGMMIRIELKKR